MMRSSVKTCSSDRKRPSYGLCPVLEPENHRGDRYGRYEIVRLIGRGAMGDVYLATDTENGRRVALKIVYRGPEPEDQEILEAERLGAELQKRLGDVDGRVADVNRYGEIEEYRRVRRTGRRRSTMGVGFADIVNYTRQSRSLSQKELSHLIDEFEARALEIIGEHEGRIIKTIGDEILFVADDAAGIARIGLELVEEAAARRGLPRAAGGSRLGTGAGQARRRARSGGQRRLPAHLDLAPGSRAGRPGTGRAARGRRALQAAPAAAYVGAGLPQARAVARLPTRTQDQRGRAMPGRPHFLPADQGPLPWSRRGGRRRRTAVRRRGRSH